MTLAIPPLLSPPALADLLAARPDVRLLDVRTPGEYLQAHIRGAYNVPLDTLGEHGREIGAQVREPVVLVCQSGGRARQAEAALRRAGMPQLHVLEGGMNAWLAAGLAVVRGPRRLSLERQVRIAAGALAATGGLLALTVSAWWALLPTVVGSGLLIAGVTDFCGMGLLLARLPYNRPATCDVPGMVDALKRRTPPPASSAA